MDNIYLIFFYSLKSCSSFLFLQSRLSSIISILFLSFPLLVVLVLVSDLAETSRATTIWFKTPILNLFHSHHYKWKRNRVCGRGQDFHQTRFGGSTSATTCWQFEIENEEIKEDIISISDSPISISWIADKRHLHEVCALVLMRALTLMIDAYVLLIVVQDDGFISCRKRKKNFFVLSHFGKPIYPGYCLFYFLCASIYIGNLHSFSALLSLILSL